MSSITDEIKNRCNIVDVVGRYVRLKRTGANYMGLCPFHSEKSPSFSVSENKQFYYCFGCGESGDVISFVQKMENLDFMTTVRRMAEQYGLNMDDYGFHNESRNNRFYEMNREAAYYFLHNLVDRPNEGRDYILGRGIDLKTVAKFGIGYAPDSWNGLLDYMTGKGYEPAELVKAGLVVSSKDRFYDRFRGRVIFPIINTRGKVLGFGGRILGEGQPKYLNSPESPVFSKRRNLFGLNLSRKEIGDNDSVFIVEGYMDMVSLYQSGIMNTVATLGTALTAEHCSILGRYTRNIILTYDSDQAGRNAALRGIEVIRNAGFNPRVLHVTDGKDPDEYIHKYGKEAFLQMAEQALPYADYRLESVRAASDLSDRQGMMQYVRAASAVIGELDPVESEFYIEKVSRMAEIPEGAIRREIAAASSRLERRENGYSRKENENNMVPQGAGTEGAGLSLQKTLIGLMAKDPGLIPGTREYTRIFTDPACYRIVDVLLNIYDEEGSVDIVKAADTLPPQDAAMLIGIVESGVFERDIRKVWQDCIGRIRITKLEEKRRDLQSILELLPMDDSGMDKIMNQLREIDAEVLRLKNNPGSE